MNLIVDAHLDLAWNAVAWDRDLTRDLKSINRTERTMKDDDARGHATICLPELRRGGVALCLATVLARYKPRGRPQLGHSRLSLDFNSSAAAYAFGQGQLSYYRFLENSGELSFITNLTELIEHWRGWEENGGERRIGIILSMEGADPILYPGQAEQWWDEGLRCASLVHYGEGPYACGTGSRGPVSMRGQELLKHFERLGIILDVTHLCDQSFFQALDSFRGPVLASHNNCRVLVPGDRQFSDEQIRLLIERDAVIGCALDAWMLYPGWKRGETPREVVGLETVVDHMDHICQLAGDCRHVAIGSDLDGGYGSEQTPVGLETIADLQKLGAILSARGYTPKDVAAIFHGNWLRFFQDHLPT